MSTAAALADPVWALIDAVSNVNTYDGEIVDANGTPVPPPHDSDGRVHAYAIYYPGAGLAYSRTLDAAPDCLDWTFQVTCVAGDRVRALWCIDKIRTALAGKWVTVNGQQLQIRQDGDSGSIRRDDNVSPSRFYLPVLFALDAP